ncbi:alpha/beta fold hydrolase [Agromyces lapidis]|uniref:Alpha/beta fold hydrolase n=1 Tax=Agromyces lapidis TaxID=279574 RepID=A0ABV5SVH6_9MICO|nr:alpha/beta hydrolase [Agromyces lapidis]
MSSPTLESVLTRTGDRVVFDRHGTAGGPAALFIQGAGPTRADDPVTTETARLLAERGFQALVYDRVGRGDSAAAGPIPLERELDAIAALAESAAGPVVLVGHSSGCAIAMLAASRVERLAGLVLWEAPLGQFADGAPAWWAEVERHLDAGELEQAVAAYMVDMPPEWLEQLKGSPDYPALVLSWIPDGRALAAVESSGAAASLGALEVPVLAVVGTETFPGMSAAADAIAAAAPRGISEELAGAWHSWDPEAMAARLAVLLDA